MAIDYRKLKSVSARQLISALKRDGFVFDSGAGSHQHYRDPDGRRVTVSFHHPSGTFATKTMKSMIALQAGWTEEDLKRLKLAK